VAQAELYQLAAEEGVDLEVTIDGLRQRLTIMADESADVMGDLFDACGGDYV
jgi:hypothetical protein